MQQKSIFEKNDHRKWKRLFTVWSEKGPWGKQNEPPFNSSKSMSAFENVLLCIWWDWNGIRKRFLQNQTNSDKHCPQLDQLKTTCNEMSWNGQLEKVSFRLGQGQISYLCRPYRNRAWLRCPTALALFTWPCTFILPLILIHTKFS